MCGGIVQSGICRLPELPGQFGLTKQLVLRITLPHISLLLISIGYALAGCWILTAINYKTDSLEAEQLIDEAKAKYKLRLVEWIEKNRRLGRDTPPTSFDLNPNLRPAHFPPNSSGRVAAARTDFAAFAADLFDIYARFPRSTAVLDHVPVTSNRGTLDKHSGRYVRGPLTNITWNLFFTVTTLTSIGYGVNAPDSLVGRLFCIFYITLGIPLFLIAISDLAKFCTEGMNRSFCEYLKLKHRLKTRWKRWKQRAKTPRIVGPTDTTESSESMDVEQVIIAGGEEEVSGQQTGENSILLLSVADFLWAHLEQTQFVEIPFLLVYIILLSYIGCKGWTTQDGFYFVLMSVLTVGFGDLMPTNDKNVLIILALILAGLVITTTCIDIIGGHYIDKLHFFGRRLDIEDPLLWLKAVQKKRIDAMKREAMRKLFETIAALNRMHLDPKLEAKVPLMPPDENAKIEPPDPPRKLVVYNATAESVCLRWEAPIFVSEGKRFCFKTRTPQRRNPITVIDFVNTTAYEVRNLKSFTLYEFSVMTTTRFGSSKPIKRQEYTEPCTVPQSVRLEAVSSETATISWRAPRKNNNAESYVLLFAQEPAAQFRFWRRYRVGKTKRFTLTQLNADTRYICCILAEHNTGLAAMSKSIRFQTRTWWFDEDETLEEKSEGEEEVVDPEFPLLPPEGFGGRAGRRPTSLSTDIANNLVEEPTGRRSAHGRRRSSQMLAPDDQWDVARTPTPLPGWQPRPIAQLLDPAENLLSLAPPRQTRAQILAARASQSQFHESPVHSRPLIALSPAGSTLYPSAPPSASSTGRRTPSLEKGELHSPFHLSPRSSK